MKKNSINKYMYFLMCVVLMFSSCAEEEFIDNVVSKEGKPVTVSLKVTEPDELLQARALTAGQERHMEDLYILIFDADGKRKFGEYYVVPNEVTQHQEATIPTNGTIDNIETTSGESYIYGIANVVENELEDLKATLDGVDTIDELFAIKATLATSGNIERNQASLLMSGAYVGGGNGGKYAGYCNIPEPAEAGGDVSLTGRIDLVRVDSRIAFNITPKGDHIETFELKSWRVYNVPDVTYLMSQDKDAAKGDDYVESKSNLNFQLENSTYTFEFYMLENRKESKEYEGTAIQAYADREKEVKELLASGETPLPGQTEKNTGVYKYVEPNAAYVEFEVEMTLNVPENSSKRVANARYVVHLGGVKGITDFYSERNYKYNYNIEIIDVDDIIVEVENDGQEPRPGAEGSVVDAQQRVFQLDAHYHTFIIEVTKNRMKPFNFQVVTPFTTYTQNDTDMAGEDLTWIQFKRNTTNSDTRLENYGGDDLLSLFELSEDVAKQNTNSDDDKLYYTIFVKEYYYDEAPEGQTWSAPYWPYFVNQPNRYAMLMFSPKYSDDGDSNYSDAVYLISQKSIQTYYSTENLNSGKNALGVEHTDEKQIKSSLSWNGNGTLSDVNGYSNTYNYVENDGYGSYFTQNGNYLTWNEQWHVPVTETSYVLAQCISRNRDEDGDGRIDGNEVKWYVPTDKQLTEIYLGAASLPNPLFDSRLHTSISSQSQYHIAASNNRRIWAEEGCSTSNFSDYGSGNVSNIRCVRNLGDATDNLVDPVYTSIEANNKVKYISVPYLREENIRTGIIDSGDLAYHDNFSETNLPWYHFEVAENFHTYNVVWGERTDVDNYLKELNDNGTKSICASYSQESDGSDLGDWRMPNQRELLLMYLVDLDVVYHKSGTQSGGVASSTYWKYDENRHFQFGVKDNVEYLFLNNDDWYGDAGAWGTVGYRGFPVVRCIRDVESVPAQ